MSGLPTTMPPSGAAPRCWAQLIGPASMAVKAATARCRPLQVLPLWQGMLTRQTGCGACVPLAQGVRHEHRGSHSTGAYQGGAPQRCILTGGGFTLLEILIALAIGSFLLAGMTSAFITQRRIYGSRAQVVEAQENVRWGLDAMAREIAMAGYDPTGSAGASISAASPTALQFSMDLNEDGDTDDAKEQVTYGLYDANGDGRSDLGRDTGDGLQLVAENISELSFLYTLADGTSTPSPTDPGQIRAVQVSLTGITARPDVQYGPHGGYRTRRLTQAIQIRNMGLER